MSIPVELADDAADVRRTIAALADEQHGPRQPHQKQRYVPLRVLRAAADLTEHRLDAVLRALYADHLVSLRVDWQSTAEDDAAAVRRGGQDYHLVSVDSWRLA